MRKGLFTIFYVLLLTVVFVLPVSAAGDLPRLVDDAGLLSESDEAVLLDELDEISERQQVDIVVVTVNSLEGASLVEYADDFYDYYDYGFGDTRDGVLFLISMEERDWCISTSGYGITAVTDAGQEYMSEEFADDLSTGNYVAAFSTFAKLCDEFITQAVYNEPYDIDNLPEESFGFGLHFVITYGVGFIIALIVTGIMKSELKSVNSQTMADDYVKKGSLQLTKKNDIFLYCHVDRRERPKESSGSSTHVSSSGTTHGGSTGKF